MSKTIFTGRVWVLTGAKGNLIEDIDTDQIYHNTYLYITDISQMGQYALGNLKGWEDFPEKARPGDIIIAGRNFGAGSSRQQAVDCFASLKVGMILAVSFGAIYFRNAVNSGFPLLKSPEIPRFLSSKQVETGDRIRVNMRSGECFNLDKRISFAFTPMSPVQYDLYRNGGLFRYAQKESQG